MSAIRKPALHVPRSQAPTLKKRVVARRPTAPTVVYLRLAWAVVLVFGEVVFFAYSVGNCSWKEVDEELEQQQEQLKAQGEQDTPAGAPAVNSQGSIGPQSPFHLLLIADPQILCLNSYPERSLPLKYLSQWIVDHYLRRSWRIVGWDKARDTDAIVFLGDLMDCGSAIEGSQRYSSYVHHFSRIFRPFPRPRDLPAIPMHYLAGNHDLGLYGTPGSSSYAKERFGKAFGPRQGEMQYGGWSVVWVDAVSLLEEKVAADRQGLSVVKGEAWSFVRELGKTQSPSPRILLSHIPLWRPDDTACGSLREHRRPINQGNGKNYQNLMDEETSDFVLTALRPTVVFSGDDHDACSVSHYYRTISDGHQNITEHNVKSFSMAMGIQRPGYHLVSLSTPPPRSTDATSPPLAPSIASSYLHQRACELPSQIGIYVSFYVPCIILSLMVLFGPKIYTHLTRPRRRIATARANGLPVPASSSPSSSRRKAAGRYLSGSEESDVSEGEDENLRHSRRFSSAGLGVFSSSAGSSTATQANGSLSLPLRSPTASGRTSPTGQPPRRLHVRRVSRVWTWESQEEKRNLWAVLRRHPVHRWLVRPVLRVTRGVLHKLGGVPGVGGVLDVAMGEDVGKGVSELGEVVWVAIAVYVLIWACFAL